MESLCEGLFGETEDCLSVVLFGHVSFYLCLQSVIEQTNLSLFLQEIKISLSKSGISSVMYFYCITQMGL